VHYFLTLAASFSSDNVPFPFFSPDSFCSDYLHVITLVSSPFPSQFPRISWWLIVAEFGITSHVCFTLVLVLFFVSVAKCPTFTLQFPRSLVREHSFPLSCIPAFLHLAFAFFIVVRTLKSLYCFQTLSAVSSLSLLLLSDIFFTLFLSDDLILEMLLSWHGSLFPLLFHC
jgi:hypothetical protein